ncbi:general stress protein [Rhizobium sp. ARZ01]|uniref:general stress protein n=1 Tax=Rhizobium sp. ARZ01 TaxID=2769313 RepID=UPI001FF012AC|nr:general stress protein [Rhizobium sp. ARZ01]
MRTVTGLFDTYNDARRAVAALESEGIPSKDISIVSHRSASEGDETFAAEGASSGVGLGALAGGTGGLLAGLGLLAIPGVGPVVAAGWLAATAAGAAAGAVAGGAAGGIIGAMINAGVSEEDANVYAEGVRRGGSMVVAKVDDPLVPVAEDVLQRSNRVDVVARRTSYQEGGWSRFDEASPVLTPEQIDEERRRWRDL